MDQPEDVLPAQLPHITVMPVGHGWVTLCSQHGALGLVWADEQAAGYGALGHAAAAHPPTLEP